MTKLAEWASWTILAIAVLSLGFVMLASRQGWEFDAVLSGSMEPSLEVGGLVVLRPVEAEDVVVGDVISFRVPNVDTPICHRVIEIQRNDGELFLRTKGDANESPDPSLVSSDNLSGRQVFYLSYLGHLTHFDRFARTPVDVLGRELTVGFVAMLMMGLAVIGLILSDVLPEIVDPSASRKRKTIERQKERLLSRRKLFLRAGK